MDVSKSMSFGQVLEQVTMELQRLLHTLFLRSPANLFDEFMLECQKWYEQPAHSFVDMRTRDNKKIRGDIFEEFCVLYLKNVRKFNQVWRLPDVPDDVLGGLGLKRPDVGIDIIAETGGKYYAIQCKYKKHVSMKKNIVTWKQLSTFYALVLRTGPWEKYIVMTNCEYARHMGKKTQKDVSICLRGLRSITKEQWVSMCGLDGHAVGAGAGPAPPPPPPPPARRKIRPAPKLDTAAAPKTQEELRAARLAYYEKKPTEEK